ncbi:hypothetical protein FN846DRAFT_606022 [Sphaerosporella brunnea]|uniref:Uncharacterized protein n=1 Tax=Sphaerosporella brunnea TaxID=1250544 RepID=A0A5J5F1P3_9PEZI|nr:hypothetical protein FN846DRAFT_606022 [Sphaerosporella brunnea]
MRQMCACGEEGGGGVKVLTWDAGALVVTRGGGRHFGGGGAGRNGRDFGLSQCFVKSDILPFSHGKDDTEACGVWILCAFFPVVAGLRTAVATGEKQLGFISWCWCWCWSSSGGGFFLVQ